MLPSAHRLRRSSEFGRTVRRGARAGRSTVVVHLLVDNEGDAAPLVGFVVSKAVGNAVQRNRVKRRLREIVRPMIAAWGNGSPGDASLVTLPAHTRAVVRALPASSTTTYAELTRDVATAFTKAALRVAPASPS